MTTLVFDIEANGLLRVADTVHCLVIADIDTKEVTRFRGKDIPAGLAMLDSTTTTSIVGHGVISYDLPLLKQVYGWVPKAEVVDTLVLSRMYYADMRDRDARAHKFRRGKWIPSKLFGKHSLESWGHRVGAPKTEYTGGWEQWSPEMEDYCEQDVLTTVEVARKLMAGDHATRASRTEHRVAAIIARTVNRGFAFDIQGAAALYAQLVERRTQIEQEMRALFPPFYMRDGGKDFVPKRDNLKMGYVAGAAMCKVKLVEFNSSSRHHIANRLINVYKWEPVEFTDDGAAKVDEDVLSKLTYPCAVTITEYLMLNKRIGQIAEGDKAWLKHASNNVLHGDINPCGAVTNRMSHYEPNLGQVPAPRSPWGKECRVLFHARKGYVLVGWDADALELRDLAGYMARYDDGAYIKTVLEGRKEDGTDMHSVNCKALGFDPTMKLMWISDKFTARDNAKTWFYAMIYGAGDFKLGLITSEFFPLNKRPKGKKGIATLGKKSRAALMSGLPALGALTKAVKDKARSAGQLKGLDGRPLFVRAEHAALNTLLQAAGAIQMKYALVILVDKLAEKGIHHGEHYHMVANVHDEVQAEVLPHLAKEYGYTACWAIAEAGRQLNFRCPLAANYVIGDNWYDTH